MPLQYNWMEGIGGALGSLGAWTVTGVRVAAILVAAWLAVFLLQRLVRGFRVRIASRLDDREVVKRAETLGRVVRYLIAVVVSLIAGMLVLSEIGISVAPILGAAGVAGLAIGFGAQSLVRDYFNGFFLLLEDQIRQGDVVKLGDHAGAVEEVTLRFVRLRDYDGRVHYVPNGEIRTVINFSRGFAQSVVDVGVAYREDVDRVMRVMQDVARELRADAGFGPRILDDFDMAGVELWDDSAVVIRGRFRVQPLEQWSVRREYLRRLKMAFDAQGIVIPFPQMTLHRSQPPLTRARPDPQAAPGAEPAAPARI